MHLLLKAPVLAQWGRFHPKEELIIFAIPGLLAELEVDNKDREVRSIVEHLKSCKPCAEVCCGFINQIRSHNH